MSLTPIKNFPFKSNIPLYQTKTFKPIFLELSMSEQNQKEEIPISTQITPQLTEPIYPSIEQFKRHTAYKFRIGTIIAGRPILENERLRFIEINNKQVSRVNIIANIVDKFVQEGEKRFASITLDDGGGQIKIKTFGDDTNKFTQLNQGDTLMIIGLLRCWNNEIYITPEIIKNKDPAFLLVRKLELEYLEPKPIDKQILLALKDKILQMIKESDKNGGIDIDKIILELKESPDIINKEIKKLIENGNAYESRPGKLRYLG